MTLTEELERRILLKNQMIVFLHEEIEQLERRLKTEKRREQHGHDQNNSTTRED